MPAKYAIFTMLSMAYDDCICVSCPVLDGVADDDTVTSFSPKELDTRIVDALSDSFRINARRRSQMAMAIVLHTQIQPTHQRTEALALAPSTEASMKVLEQIQEGKHSGSLLRDNAMQFRDSTVAVLRHLAFNRVQILMDNVRVEFSAIDSHWTFARTTNRIENNVLKLERTMEKSKIEDLGYLLKYAREISEVMRAVRAAHEQLKAVAIPKFGLYQNFAMAQLLKGSHDQRIKNFGASISRLHTQCSRGYRSNGPQFSRDLAKLTARLQRSARPFKNMAVSAADFEEKLRELLGKLESLQSKAFSRFPIGEEVERSIVRITRDLTFPTVDIKVLFTGVDGAAIEGYIQSKKEELNALNTQVDALPVVPTDLAPFMGAHSEEAPIATGRFSFVKNLRVARIGGDTDLLAGRNKLYRSDPSDYAAHQESIVLFTRDIDLLHERGIKRILSVSSLGYSMLSKVLLKDGDIRLKELPMDQLPEAVMFLDAARREGEDILVHCGRRSGCTGSVVASYEVSKVMETWEPAHGTRMPRHAVLTYLAERSRFSYSDFLRHGIRGKAQEKTVRSYALWQLLAGTASKLSSELLNLERESYTSKNRNV